MNQINVINNLHHSITSTKKVYLKRQHNKPLPTNSSIDTHQSEYIYQEFFSTTNNTTLEKLYCNINKEKYHAKVESLVKQYFEDRELTILKYDEDKNDGVSYLEVSIDDFKKTISNRIKIKLGSIIKKKSNEYGNRNNTILEQQHHITKMVQEMEQHTSHLNRWFQHHQEMMNVLATYHKCIDSNDMDGMIVLKQTLESNFLKVVVMPKYKKKTDVVEKFMDYYSNMMVLVMKYNNVIANGNNNELEELQQNWDSYVIGNLTNYTTQYKKRFKVSPVHHIGTQPVIINATGRTIVENLSQPQEEEVARTQQAEEDNCRITAENLATHEANIAANTLKLESLQHLIAEAQEEIKSQQGRIAEAQDESQQRLIAKEQELESLKHNIAAKTHEFELLIGRIAEAKELESLQSTIADTQKLESQQRRFAEAQELELHQSKIAAKEKELDSLQCIIAKAQEVESQRRIIAKEQELDSQERIIAKEQELKLLQPKIDANTQELLVLIRRIAAANELESQQGTISVDNVARQHTEEDHSINAAENSDSIANQQEAIEPSHPAEQLEYHNQCDQIIHIKDTSKFLKKSELERLVKMFVNSDQLDLPEPVSAMPQAKKN